MSLYEIEPGTATASYIHDCEHEVSVLSGKWVVTGQNGEVALGEGEVIYIPPAEHHQLASRGDEVLLFLLVLLIPQRIFL